MARITSWIGEMIKTGRLYHLISLSDHILVFLYLVCCFSCRNDTEGH